MKAEHRHASTVHPARRRRPAAPPSVEKSIVRPSRRGGVPVFRRPCGSFNSFSRADSVTAGGSPARPAAWLSRPTWILPSRKVPAVSTTARSIEANAHLRDNAGHPVAFDHQVVAGGLEQPEFGWFSSRRRIAALYSTRSA